MRVAINLLTDDPANPSGAHWFWTRVIPEMAKRLTDDEEFHLLVSPKSRPMHQGYGPSVHYITFPWSNESPPRRTLSEHLYAPIRLPDAKIDVFSTLMAPIVKPAPSLVVHFKTMHAYTAPQALRLVCAPVPPVELPPHGQGGRRGHHQLREPAPRGATVSRRRPGRSCTSSRRRSTTTSSGRAIGTRPGSTSAKDTASRSRSCSSSPPCGRTRTAPVCSARSPSPSAKLGDRQLVVVGPGRDAEYVAELHALADELGIAKDVVWVGGVPLEETVHFYRSADVFVYPSFNETFGLPILEAMACACPVVTSNISAMPETAGGAALLADPTDPESLADAIVKACGEQESGCGSRAERAGEFTWAATAERTLDVYREVHSRRLAARNGRR